VEEANSKNDSGFLEHFQALSDTQNWLIELIPHDDFAAFMVSD
jgi:hypothetical protein